MIGLERTIFLEFENVVVVELCARVFEPDIDCPIEFPFEVILSTVNRNAGIPRALTVTDINSDTFPQRVLWITLAFL